MPSRLGPWSVSRRRSWVLVLLCAVQGCERFAFLAMVPLFVVFVHERHSLSTSGALLVLALVQALSYLGGLPFGLLADRWLGARASTMLGALLLAAGYGGLGLDGAAGLWAALALLVVGQSLFRPGLHVLIAGEAGGDEHARERSFLWHYLAANVGHVAGALFGEWAHAAHGWRLLFGGAAAISLLAVGLLWLALRGSATPQIDEQPERTRIPTANGNMAAVWRMCSVAVVFWLTAQQAGSSLTVFAARNTTPAMTLLGRTIAIGPGHFAALHGLMVLALLPAALALHGRTSWRASSSAARMFWGYMATAVAFAVMTMASLAGGDHGRVGGEWLAGCYFFLSLAEVLLAPLGVALVTQLAPSGKRAWAVGLWFAGSALGHGLSGLMSLGWERWPHHRYFAVLALLSLGAAGVLLPRRRKVG